MKYTQVICDHCGNIVHKQNRYYNYSKKLGMKMYCDSTCSAAAKHAKHGERTPQQREAGRLYYKKWYEKNKLSISKKRKDERYLLTQALVSGDNATITVLENDGVLPKGGVG